MYYKLPKTFFTNIRYDSLSLESMVLYCILSDRVWLSEHNGMHDDKGRTYIFFTRREIAKLLRVSVRSAIKYVNELEKCGLISFGSKVGHTSPPIYVKDVTEKKNKKPATNMWQEKSYDDDEIRQALIRQFMEE